MAGARVVPINWDQDKSALKGKSYHTYYIILFKIYIEIKKKYSIRLMGFYFLGVIPN